MFRKENMKIKTPKGITKVATNDYQPRRFGVKYNPPMIVLEYLVPSSGKLYHHRMMLSRLEKDFNIKEMVNTISKKHSAYLNHPKISPQQIEALVNKLYEHQFKFVKDDITKCKSIKKSQVISKENIDYNNYDLNKLSDHELEKHKQKMEEVFLKNSKDPKAHDFVYDLEVEFKPSHTNADWDEDEKDENTDF